MLTAEERAKVDQAASKLAIARQGNDGELIEQAIKNLEQESEVFIARRMNRSVQQVMKGHRVEEFE